MSSQKAYSYSLYGLGIEVCDLLFVAQVAEFQ